MQPPTNERVTPGQWIANAILLAAVGASSAQAQSLQHRKPSPNQSAPAAQTGGRQVLPLAAEGEYRWGESGEIIELYLEDGAIQGYLTRRSERADAHSAPMTFTFTDTSTADGLLHFTTRHIHGDWYSFTGRLVRSSAAHNNAGYLLTGTLETHLGLAGPDEPLTRQVSLRREVDTR